MEGEPMNIRHVNRLALLLALLLALAIGGGALAEEAPAAEVAAHNYILLIDNSRSTTGRHSLGGATDPKGLRFDAAKLVYQNVVTSAATGAKGQLGVIVFCGTKNCVVYGPLDISDTALYTQIGSKLNEAANAARRDDFTDIRTALQKAKEMQAGFDGATSVLLLTDGVNDLTNKANPFSRPENIAANEESIRLVGELRDAGADVHIVALTDTEDVDKSAPFMTFINRLAGAGGGEASPETGDFSNVLMATQADLNSKLVQTLIRAESESDAIQTIVEYTPVNEPFTVPYGGITEATVNITFMPEDKEHLERVALITPGGEEHTLWDAAGVHEADGITATEDRSYIMLNIPAPEVGDWTVVVTGKKQGRADARALINAVVRFNHSLRLNVEMDDVIVVDTSARINAWLQEYDGEGFIDLTDSEIYAQSQAQMTVTTPGGKKKTIDMKREGDRYTVAFRAKTPGEWTAQIRVKNPWVAETVDDIHFRVIEAPTPTPTPTPTPKPTPTPTPTPSPTPEVGLIQRLDLSVEPCVTAETGEVFLLPGDATFSWQLDGETESVSAEVLEGGKSLGSIVSGITFPGSFFREGTEYVFRVSAMPKNGELAGIEPTVKTMTFRAAPAALAAEDIALSVEPVKDDRDDALYVDRDASQITVAWNVNRPTDSVEAALLKDGEVLAEGLQSGGAIDRALLEDGAEYTLRVAALPENGALVGLEPTEQTLSFRLYPRPEAIEGLSLGVSGTQANNGTVKLKNRKASLTWQMDSGNVDHYELAVTDAKGGEALRQTLPAGSTGYDLTLPRSGDYDVTLSAAARYAPEAEAPATATLRLHTLTFLEKYWYFIAAGALLLAGGAVALFMALKERNAKHVVGSLRVRCEALALDELLTLMEDRKGVKLDDPITRHPALAKLKGKKSYALLENLRLNNAMTDRAGLAPGESDHGEARHRPNVRVVRLTYANPKTGQTTVAYVGRYDPVPVTMTLEDGVTSCEFTFSGS